MWDQIKQWATLNLGAREVAWFVYIGCAWLVFREGSQCWVSVLRAGKALYSGCWSHRGLVTHFCFGDRSISDVFAH